MNNPVAIGVVGTAKNTGKTTTLSYLMEYAHRSGRNMAVTGIGYDGEEIDNITMLPKSRLYLHKGTILTTAEMCLKRSPVEYRIILRTGISTALGELLIVEVTKSGYIVVAGPNKAASLSTVLDHIKKLKRDVVFVDGSINRMLPMSIVNRLIFSTGAARNVEASFLTAEMKAIEFLFRPPVVSGDYNSETVSIVRNNENPVQLALRSVIDEEDVNLIRYQLSAGNNKIFIPGLISKDALQHIDRIIVNSPEKIQLVLASPFTLLLSENVMGLVPVIESLIEKGSKISYLRKPQLAGVTVNPFYPLYEGGRFSAAYIDKNKLMHEMKESLSTPVFNVMEDGGEALFALCQ